MVCHTLKVALGRIANERIFCWMAAGVTPVMQSEDETRKLPICLVTQGQIRRDSRTNTVPGYLLPRNSVFTESSICNLQFLEYFRIHIPKHRVRQNYQIVQGIPPQ